MQSWTLHSLSLLALEVAYLEIFKGFFTFPIMKELFPCVLFPPLTSLPDNVILKANNFSGMLFSILLFHKMTVQSVQTALNLDKYAACSIKVVSESFGLHADPFGLFVKLESPSFYCNLDNKCNFLFSILFKKKTHI